MNTKERRALEKRLGKFHTAHFPVGTVIEWEDPFTKFQHDEERTYPDEAYRRSTGTVIEVTETITNNFIVRVATQCPVTNKEPGINTPGSFNMDWVRKIVSRGNGTLNAVDQEFVDGMREYTVPTERQCTYPGPGNRYTFYCVRELAMTYLQRVGATSHVIDFDKLISEISAKLNYRKVGVNTFFNLKSVNKKRFARVFQAAYARAKVNRKKVERDREREEAEFYNREFSVFED